MNSKGKSTQSYKKKEKTAIATLKKGNPFLFSRGTNLRIPFVIQFFVFSLEEIRRKGCSASLSRSVCNLLVALASKLAFVHADVVVVAG